MHLAEVLGLRPVAGAAVAFAVTQRCPLSCAHCSTDSTMSGAEHPAGLFERFAATFTPEDHPRLLMLTGGEPLLRPRLVRALTRTSAEVGTRVYLQTGGFFARATRPAPAVMAALAAVDHVSVSMDAFHEREVPRERVYRLLRLLMAAGGAVSVQLTGAGEDDPYLTTVIGEIRAGFGDRVPMTVGLLRPAGRAARLSPPPAAASGLPAEPCAMAAWPVVTYDGTVTACGNQRVVDHDPLPAHLRLGHVATDDWPAIRERCLRAPMLRALRLFGPGHLDGGRHPGGGYCATCRALGDDPAALAESERLTARPVTPVLEEQVLRLQLAGGPEGFVRRYGSPRYAGLAVLGYRGVPA